MNNGSKGRCVTITPQASDEKITWLKAGLGASPLWSKCLVQKETTRRPRMREKSLVLSVTTPKP